MSEINKVILKNNTIYPDCENCYFWDKMPKIYWSKYLCSNYKPVDNRSAGSFECKNFKQKEKKPKKEKWKKKSL